MIFRREINLDLQPEELAGKLVGENLQQIMWDVIEKVSEALERDENVSNSDCAWVVLTTDLDKVHHQHPSKGWKFSVELDLAFDPKLLREERVLDLVVFTCEAKISYGTMDFYTIDVDEVGFDLELEQEVHHCFTEELRARGFIGALAEKFKLNNININSITLTEDQL